MNLPQRRVAAPFLRTLGQMPMGQQVMQTLTPPPAGQVAPPAGQVATAPVPPVTPPPGMVLTCYPQQPAPATPPNETISGALAPFTPTSTWRSNLFTPQQLTSTGQPVPTTPTDTWALLASTLGIAGTAAGVYHGYKRHNGSILMTLGWGLFGGLLPIIAIPWALAQGFGKPAGGGGSSSGARARAR